MEWLKNHQKIRLVARDRASAYAAAINAVLPDCVQVSDRFHLLQNLLEYLKDIFKAEMPFNIYIKDGKILDQEPEKILREKEPDKNYLATLHYDNTPPMNPDGSEQFYDNKNHCLSRKQYKDQAENRKKRQLIFEVRQFWENLEKKKITTVAEHFDISSPTAKRYIHMTASEIEGMDSPKNYKKRESPMNKWLNVIFKMMLDGHSNETIYFYIREQENFAESPEQLGKYIYLIEKNNFPERVPFNGRYLMENVMPPDIICFKRTEILKYLLTCNPKVQKDKELGKYIDLIREKFPAASYAENIFKEFHVILMGNEPEKIDGFLEKYSDGELTAFCNGIAATRKTGGSVWGYKPLLLGQRLKMLAFSLRYGNTGKQYFHSSVQA